MTARRTALAGLIVVTAIAVGWVLFIGLPRWYGPAAPASPPPAAPVPGSDDVRKIKVRLFYVGTDGTRLTSVEHEVPFAEQTVAQARHIVEAQLAPVQAPLVSAIPQGSALRAIFLAPDGTAFVDLSREVSTAHPGGSLNELLTIYTIVQALTTNLPAISGVQLLIDGKEVDTLAGHVDLTRPLPRADAWVSDELPAQAAPASPVSTPPIAEAPATPPPPASTPAR